jgi:zinc protease
MRQKVGQLRGLSVVDTSQATKEEPMLPQAANLYRIVPTGLIAVLCSCASMPTAQMQEPATPAPTVDEQDRQLAIDPAVITGVLDNGMRYVIRANAKPENRAELRLALDVGSILETDEEQGLAHFVEHMAFNGTRHFAKQELWDYLERVGLRIGADLNAHTSFDETVYKLTVPTDSTQIVETAMQIFEDWAHGVSFDGEEIDKERGVVIEEWRRGQGASTRMLHKQLPALFADSKYASRIPIGQKAVLDTFQHDVLRGFYDKWYRADLMSFIAVGDFEPAYMESLIVEYLSRVPAPATPTVRPESPVPGHDETLFAIATDPEATQNTVLVYHKHDRLEQQTVRVYRHSLMEGLYHGMLNRRLYELTVQAEPPFLGGYSGIGLSVRTKEFLLLGAAVENNGFERGLDALLTEASRVAQHGFTATELARQKKQMLRGMEQAFRERDKLQSSGFASEYIRHVLEEEPIPGIEAEYELYGTWLPTITLTEVNELAQSWAGSVNRVIAINAPEKEGVGVPTEADLLATFETVEGVSVEPYVDQGEDLPLLPNEPTPGHIVGRDEIAELGVTIWELSNGARVMLKPTDFKNDQILFSAYSPGGHSLVPDADYIPAATASTIVTQGGLGNFDQVGLMKWLTGRVVGVNPYVAELHEGLSGSASPQDSETMFQLIHGYFTATRTDSVTFASLRTRLGAMVENRSSRPETAYGDTIQVTMAQHHYRARPWSEAMLQELDLQTSMQVFQERFADASDFTFFLVGNLDMESVEPLVERYLASLPALHRAEIWRDVDKNPPTGVVTRTVRRGMEPKSATRIIFSGPFDFANRLDRLQIGLMAEAFQIKLREVLREDLGGTYSVGVGARPARYPTGNYRLTVSFGCDPERVEELTAVVFAQIKSLQTEGLDSTYTDKVREIRRREREVNLKENGWWLGLLEWVDKYDVDPLLILDDSVAENFSPADVLRAAKWFDMTNYAQFVMLPEPQETESQETESQETEEQQ